MPDPVTNLVSTAASSAFKSMLPHLLNPFTRRKVLQLLLDSLLGACQTPQQAHDLFNRVKDDSTLKRIARLQTINEVHLIVAKAVQPIGRGDPQHFEALILTQALFSALLQATSPAGSAIVHSMILDLYLRETLPAYNELIRSHQYRQQHPGRAAVTDLAAILQEAGQTGMGLVTLPDQSVHAVGNIKIDFQVKGRNAELLDQWRQGGHGTTIWLRPEDGEVSLSFGHAELDKLLLPARHGRALTYQFSEVKTYSKTRARVAAPGEADVYVDLQIGFAPASREVELIFGRDACHLKFVMTDVAMGGTKVHINFVVDSQDRPLPLEYRDILRALRLLGRSDMHVDLVKGQQITQSDQTSRTLDKDEEVLDGRIWTSSRPSDEPPIEEYLWPVGEAHLLYQSIAQYLEETHGIDASQVTLPPVQTDESLAILRRAVGIINNMAEFKDVNLSFSVSSEMKNLIEASQQGANHPDAEVQFGIALQYTSVLDLGIRVIEIKSDVLNVAIQSIEPERGELWKVNATGVMQNHQLIVHPAGYYEELMA